MGKAVSQRESAANDLLKGKGQDGIAYRQALDTLSKSVPFAEAFVVASVPRSGLQLVQPARVPDILVNAYCTEFHTEDRASWQAIAKNKPVRGTDAWGNNYDGSRYLRDFLLYNCNLYHMVAVPLKGPIFAGYPGALHLYRMHEQGAFSDSEIAHCVSLAKDIDAAVEIQRTARRPAHCTHQAPWAHRLSTRMFVLNSKMNPVLGGDVVSALDDRLHDQLMQHAEHRLENIPDDGEIPADRLQTPDSRGDLWTFRATTYRSYPALGEGPMIFFTLQPEACDWATIRPSDFLADQEMSRLVPAVRFMQQDFHRSPTLSEISRSVHLSPFHFHRRFTELFGLTPKHFLLECQIFEAKRQLMARQKELAQIASDCGFAHQSHFTSRFKQATGLTPTRWRRVAQDMQRSVKF